MMYSIVIPEYNSSAKKEEKKSKKGLSFSEFMKTAKSIKG